MSDESRWQVELIVEFPEASSVVAYSNDQIEAFVSDLRQALAAEGLGMLERCRECAGRYVAHIEPPTRIGYALEIAAMRLKMHKLKRGTGLLFQKIERHHDILAALGHFSADG